MNGEIRHCEVPHESKISTLKVIIAEKEYTMPSQRMWNQTVEAYCCTWWNMIQPNVDSEQTTTMVICAEVWKVLLMGHLASPSNCFYSFCMVS